MKYIVALDQGTTSSRAVVFDKTGNIVASHSIEFRQIYPQPGYVEHDPYDILQSQRDSLRYAVQKAGIDVLDIEAIGITNQRETTIVWDKKTGKPLYNAIVWQCRRTADICKKLIQDGLGERIRQKTGLVVDAYFSGTKLAWLLQNVPEARAAADKGELCFGTVDSFLVYNLTGGKVHVTDYTNASRTMMFNIYSLEWDKDILHMLDIPESVLPTVCDTSGVVGMLDPAILGREIPIASIAGDQHAALFGQGCTQPGMVKNTYGTGCFVLMNTGEKPVNSKNKLVGTIGWSYGGKTTYALEGSVFVAGAVIQWLRDELKLIDDAAQTEEIAKSIESTGGVYLVPSFTGLGAPYWDMYSRGTLVGITRGTGRAHIVRAALESIALQSYDVISAMQRDSGISLEQLRVDGGASKNGFLMQFQSDILGIPVRRPKVVETTALGAAMFAGLAVGYWNENELKDVWQEGGSFNPNADPETVKKTVEKWHKAVQRSLAWEE